MTPEKRRRGRQIRKTQRQWRRVNASLVPASASARLFADACIALGNAATGTVVNLESLNLKENP